MVVIVDKRNNQPERLFVYSNGNGDLADDPPARWHKEDRIGVAMVKIPYASGAKEASLLVMWHRGIMYPMREILFCAADYGLVGQVKLGVHTYRAGLEEPLVGGDFRGSSPTSRAGQVVLWLDLNGHGEFAHSGEGFDVAKPLSPRWDNMGGSGHDGRGLLWNKEVICQCCFDGSLADQWDSHPLVVSTNLKNGGCLQLKRREDI